MSTKNPLAPIKILDSKILGVEFKLFDAVEDKDDFENMFITKYKRGRSFIENDCLRCEAVLEVVIKREYKKLESSTFFIASCKVGITTATPLKSIENFSEAESEQITRANGISIAYGKIRSIIESITAESLVGKQTIPPIYPYALLERDSASEDQDS